MHVLGYPTSSKFWCQNTFLIKLGYIIVLNNRIFLPLCSLVFSILTLFIDSFGITTLVPGLLPTENLPTKSIPSNSHNTKPAEKFPNKKAENPVIVPVLH